jgi:hypothetical protein
MSLNTCNENVYIINTAHIITPSHVIQIRLLYPWEIWLAEFRIYQICKIKHILNKYMIIHISFAQRWIWHTYTPANSFEQIPSEHRRNETENTLNINLICITWEGVIMCAVLHGMQYGFFKIVHEIGYLVFHNYFVFFWFFFPEFTFPIRSGFNSYVPLVKNVCPIGCLH